MAESCQVEIPASIARRFRGLQNPSQGDAAELFGRLRLVCRNVLQNHRDQLSGARIHSPEMLVREIELRLVHGLIHRSDDPPHADPQPGRDCQLQLADAILENHRQISPENEPQSSPGAPADQLNALHTLRSAMTHFFHKLCSIPSIPEELRNQLIDLACEVLGGENPTLDDCAKRLAWSRTSTLLTCEMLFKVARHRQNIPGNPARHRSSLGDSHHSEC